MSLALGALVMFAPASNATYIIDTFTITQRVDVRDPDATPNQEFNRIVNASLFGGDRELFVERQNLAANTNEDAVLKTGPVGPGIGRLDLNVATDNRGRGMVTYDGNGPGDTITSAFGAHPSNFDLGFNFVQPVPLAVPYVAFNFRASSGNPGFPLTLRVYGQNSGVHTTYVLPLLNGSNLYTVNYADFTPVGGTNAAIFANAGAFVISFGSATLTNDPFSADASLNFIRLSAVPEPGTMALFGAGIIGLAVVARRRRLR